MKSGFIFFLFYIIAVPLVAQSPELTKAYQNKVNYLSTQDTAKAVQWGEKALALAEKDFGKTSPSYANYASDLASLYQMQHKLDKAEQLYMVSYKIYLREYGEEHPYTSTTVFNLGIIYENLEKYDRAAENYVKALKGYEISLGKDHAYYEMVLKYIINLYVKSDQYEKLEKYYLISLELIEKKKGKELEYAYELNNLGLCYYYQRKYDLAKATLQESLKLLEAKATGNPDDLKNSLLSLYQVYYETQEIDKATQYLVKATEFVRKKSGSTSREYAVMLSYLGELHRNTTNYPKAETEFKEALAIIEKSDGKRSEEYATLVNNLGYLYKLTGEYSKAEKYLLESLTLSAELGNKESATYAIASNNMGLLKVAQGKYEEAESYYLQALSLHKKISGGTSAEYSSTLNNLGLLNFYMGKFTRALVQLEEALKVKSSVIGSRHFEYANTLVNIALVHTEKGEYHEAEGLYKESLSIYENSVGKKDLKYANALTNFAEIYTKIGQFDKALDLHTQALKAKEASVGSEHPEYAISLNFIGISLLNLNRPDEAKKYFTAGLNLRKKLLPVDHPDITASMSNLSLVHLREGNLKEASWLLEQCVERESKRKDKDELLYATYLNNLASVLEAKGVLDRSRDLFLEVLAIREQKLPKDHTLIADVSSNLAYLYLDRNELGKAEPYFFRANDIYNKTIRTVFPYLTEKDRETFFFQFKDHINNFYAFCVQRAKDNPAILEQMYNTQLNFKALLLNETKTLRKHVLSKEDEALKNAYEKWITQREYLAKLYSLDKRDLEQRHVSLEKEEEKANELEKQFSAVSGYKGGYLLENVTWKDVQRKLKTGEAAVEVIRYHFKDKDSSQTAYVALVVSSFTKVHPELVIIHQGAQIEKQFYAYYINSIKHLNEDLLSYKRYWEPVGKAVAKEGTIRKVYISGDGIYNKISLYSLKNPDSKNYLVDEIRIDLVSNTKELTEIKEKGKESIRRCELYGFPDYSFNSSPVQEERTLNAASSVSDTLSRFYNGQEIKELPGTEKEVLEINRLLKDKGVATKVFLRKEATEDQLKHIDSPDVLHIATHGFFLRDGDLAHEEETLSSFELTKYKQNPLLRSGLLFAGVNQTLSRKASDAAQDEDGIFTAYEAMNIDLTKTQLVVLSACETGLGEIKNGEGVYGLQRAFEIAGAQTLLMSLWTVNDEATRELMVSFYKYWMETGEKREGFLKAQMQIREKYKHPYYWAGFVLIGE